MALKRGMAAVREAKADRGGNNGGLRLIMDAGETVLMRFYGDFENDQDPVVGCNHYVKRLERGKQYNNCGENTDQECVFCYAKNHGDKGVGKSGRAYFHVKDLRRIHKLENAVKVLKPGVTVKPGRAADPRDLRETRFPPCSGKNCQFCRSGSEPVINGHRYFELATSHADQLTSQQPDLRDYCKCGARTEEGGGTLGVTGYLCGHCQAPVNFSSDSGKPVATCLKCKRTEVPLEQLECGNEDCGEPRRCDIPDFYFRVKKTGSGTDTVFNFEPVHPCKPPTDEELAEAAEKKPNFEELLAPEPPELQARLLGIPNPFEPSPGHGATGYEEPYDPGTDMPDEEEYKPAKTAARPVAAKPVMKPGAPAKPVAGLPPKVKFRIPGRRPAEDDGIPF